MYFYNLWGLSTLDCDHLVVCHSMFGHVVYLFLVL